jgi:hypothetical protein
MCPTPESVAVEKGKGAVGDPAAIVDSGLPKDPDAPAVSVVELDIAMM